MYTKKQVNDPIDSLTETEKAYIAGLLDGDGTLYIQSLGRRRNKEALYPSIRLLMTHEGVITWLANKLQAHKVHRLPARNPERFINGTRPQYQFSLWGKRAQRLARAILPYLHVKRTQAEIISQFPVWPQGKPLTIEVRRLRLALREQMIDANGRRERGLNIVIPTIR